MPGKSHGQRSLAGYSPWGLKESDMTEWLYFSFTGRQGRLSRANIHGLLGRVSVLVWPEQKWGRRDSWNQVTVGPVMKEDKLHPGGSTEPWRLQTESRLMIYSLQWPLCQPARRWAWWEGGETSRGRDIHATTGHSGLRRGQGSDRRTEGVQIWEAVQARLPGEAIEGGSQGLTWGTQFREGMLFIEMRACLR